MHLKPLLTLSVTAICLGTTGCTHSSPDAEFPKLTEEFVYKTLSFSPVYASSQGLHQYKGVNFDTQLDDVSRQSIQQQRDFYADFHKRLEAFNKSSLTPEDRQITTSSTRKSVWPCSIWISRKAGSIPPVLRRIDR